MTRAWPSRAASNEPRAKMRAWAAASLGAAGQQRPGFQLRRAEKLLSQPPPLPQPQRSKLTLRRCAWARTQEL